MRYLLSILLLFSAHSFAQPDPLGEFNKHTLANWNGEYHRVGPYKVKGSTYLFGNAFPGYINYKGGITARDKMVYFDIYNYEIGIIEKNVKYNATGLVEDFVIILPEQYGGKELRFKNADSFGNSAPKGFFNIVEDGKKLSLLKYFKTNLITDPVNQMDREARVFEQAYEYYIYNKMANELQKIKLKEKDIAKALNDKKFMDEVIRAKKIDLNKEASVVNAINLYNNY